MIKSDTKITGFRWTARVLAVFTLSVVARVTAGAAPVPSPLFGNYAALQTGKETPIWGTAKPGEHITISYVGKQAKAVADHSGKWKATLADLAAGLSGELVMKGEDGSVTSRDVVTGDVWLCVGQSNMEWNLGRTSDAAIAVANANHPKIRQFLATGGKRLPGEICGEWSVCTPETARKFTAVGYYYACEIEKTRGIPVGIINCSWGGTYIESWMSPASLSSHPEFSTVKDRWAKRQAEYPPKKKAYDEALAAWKISKAQAVAANQPFSEKEPADPWQGQIRNEPSKAFTLYIKPLIPVGLKGILWYQGEQNVGRFSEYSLLFRTLIADWRTLWNTPSLPFLYVQLPNVNEGWGPQRWPELRAAQAEALSIPHTAMAIAIDIGDPNDVHPRDKKSLGYRLALLARKHFYGEDIVADGPRLKSWKIVGAEVHLTFQTEQTADLKLREPVQGLSFELAGSDEKFVPAEATLQHNSIVLKASEISVPVWARYLWKGNPSVILYNTEELPAAPFRVHLVL